MSERPYHGATARSQHGMNADVKQNDYGHLTMHVKNNELGFNPPNTFLKPAWIGSSIGMRTQ